MTRHNSGPEKCGGVIRADGATAGIDSDARGENAKYHTEFIHRAEKRYF